MSKNSPHTLKEDILNILRLLSSKGDLSQRDVSEHLEISLGKTNYLLKSLIKKNLIKARSFSRNRNKLNKVKYILTKRGFKEKISLTYHFLKKKELEYYYIRNEWDKLREQLKPDNQKAETQEVYTELKGAGSDAE